MGGKFTRSRYAERGHRVIALTRLEYTAMCPARFGRAIIQQGSYAFRLGYATRGQEEATAPHLEDWWRFMPSLPEVEPGRLQRMPGYSAAMRSALVFCALAVTLLPIPLTYLGILPAYRVHAWFLLFYAPFLCLLTLCYLFYVRDSLARAMFADVLDPPPPPDPYYREALGDRLKRGYRRLKGILLGILPVLLVITSMYSVSRYLASMNESVALAAETYVERAAASKEVGALAASLLLDQLTGVAELEAGASLLPAVLVARHTVARPPDRKRGLAGRIGTRH